MKIIKNFFTFFTFAFLLTTCSESTTSSPSVDPNVPALKALIYTNAKGNLITSINAKPGFATNLYPKLLNLPEGVSATNYSLKASSSLPPNLKIDSKTGLIFGTFANADAINNHKYTIIAVLNDDSATKLEYTLTFTLAAPNVPALKALIYTNAKGNLITSINAIWGEATNLRPALINLPGETTATGYALKAGSSLPTGLIIDPTTGIISGNLNHASSLDNHESTIEVTLSDSSKLEVELTFTVPLAELSYKDADDSPVSTVTADIGKAITLSPSLDKAFSTVSASYEVKSGSPVLPDGLNIDDNGFISGTLNAGVDNAAVTIEATLNDVTKIEKIITFNIISGSVVYTNINKNEISTVVAKAGVSTNLSPKKDNIPTGAGITALYAFKGNTTASTNGLKINTTTGLISGVFDRSFTNDITVKLTLTINRVNTVLEKAITFEIEPAETPFSARNSHQVVAYKDEMYLIGGDDGYREDDVWKSTNGANWVEVTKDSAFGARWGHQVVVFDSEMYLVGGHDGGGAYKNDVWKSSDGEKWVEVTNDAAFSTRYAHQVVVLGDKMYLIGGYTVDFKGDVWESSNGKDWTRLIEYATFVPSTGTRIIHNHQVVVLNNKMYIIGGIKSLTTRVNDIYNSTDGTTWSPVTTTDVFSARESHQVVVLNNKMYLIGGYDGTTKLSDVYKSSDGAAWDELISNGNAPFSKRRNQQMVVLGDEMYLIGGDDGTNRFKDVWKSSNGKDWFLISK